LPKRPTSNNPEQPALPKALGKRDSNVSVDIANRSQRGFDFRLAPKLGGRAISARLKQEAKVLTALEPLRCSSTGKQDFKLPHPLLLCGISCRKDPLEAFAGCGRQYQQLAKAIMAYRDKDQKPASSQARCPRQGLRRHARRGSQRSKDGFPPRPSPFANAEYLQRKVGGEYAIRLPSYPLCVAGMLVMLGIYAFRSSGFTGGGGSGGIPTS